MLVLLIAYSVKLKIGAVQSRFLCPVCKVFALCKPDTVGRSQNAVKSYFLCIGDSLEKMGRQCRLST